MFKFNSANRSTIEQNDLYYSTVAEIEIEVKSIGMEVMAYQLINTVNHSTYSYHKLSFTTMLYCVMLAF